MRNLIEGQRGVNSDSFELLFAKIRHLIWAIVDNNAGVLRLSGVPVARNSLTQRIPRLNAEI